MIASGFNEEAPYLDAPPTAFGMAMIEFGEVRTKAGRSSVVEGESPALRSIPVGVIGFWMSRPGYPGRCYGQSR
jgi:hypothetical protein